MTNLPISFQYKKEIYNEQTFWRTEFFGVRTGNVDYFLLTFRTEEKLKEIANFIKLLLPSAISRQEANFCMEIRNGNDSYFYLDRTFRGKVKEFSLHGWGSEETLKYIKTNFKNKYPNDYPKITWYYKQDGEIRKDRFILDNQKPYHPEFFPWIQENLVDDYIKSDVPILLLSGDPGTGKTSFIRNILFKHKMRAIVTYEDDLIKSDALFVEFMTGEYDLLVFEDADLMLRSREKHGNEGLAKILNVSEGLIKIPKKKIIFSTNISDFTQIDDAVIRPGRCFKFLEFRNLTQDEAIRACAAANIPLVQTQKEYTLAEIFNPHMKVEQRRVGFR